MINHMTSDLFWNFRQMTYLYLNGLTDSMQIQNFDKNTFYKKTNNYTILVNKSKLTYSSNENQFEYKYDI